MKHCELGTAGAVELSTAECLEGLAELDLRYNKIGPEGIEALAKGERLRSIQSLWISDGNKGTAASLDALRAALPQGATMS